ncbi:MAG TPA: glycoside hydrolase family 38 C-terminal domain-containing protein [Candidatus Paceibacterota bacterium]|nr:glycoside hydrolase family 38 C-terminal domain-containing protein [Verrucomicrobiota bacterium]HSA10487.1 glycoside hydrolase family 38 C-terminal domain-containing protein [Candidatus Paceibacterota bacterium]
MNELHPAGCVLPRVINGCRFALAAWFLWFCPVEALGQISIERVDATPFFPRVESGQPLRQVAKLHLNNAGAAAALEVRMTLGSVAHTEDLGEVPAGRSTNTVHVPDLAAPAKLIVELLPKGAAGVLARHELGWRPQKKWKVYCVSYSHHDLGFGNYPHRLRTEIRHANIERPLQFCAETDGWDEDSKFRYVIETSEPITSFLGSHSETDAVELARRIREGRIQVGALHNTANTEQMSQELMARLFYLGGRHTPDLLGVARGNTAQIDDVIGLTWPLATYCAEAGVPYLFHGHNGVGQCLRPASAEPVFYWQGPDGGSKVLVRSIDYGGYAGDNLGDASENHLQSLIARLGSNWPYDTLLCQDGTDFQLITLDNVQKIRRWNARYAYPRLVSATMAMFFQEIMRQAEPARIKTFAKDSNNQWADQDSTDAWLLALARRQGEAIPTAEKFSTIAMATAGGGYPWTDIYQAYHRLLQYHEHTDAIDFINCDPERMRQYETELVENREMVVESKEFTDRARESALVRLAGMMTTTAATNILVFNPLTRTRTDVVRMAAAELGRRFQLRDGRTGKEVAHQALADGTVLFVAADVPSLGCKTFSVAASPATDSPQREEALSDESKIAERESPLAEGSLAAAPASLENGFYRIAFDRASGAITSIRDRQLGVELVDEGAPHKFNEYLYERYESPNARTSKWYRVQSAQVAVARGPVADVLSVRASAVGADKIEQAVLLYHDLKRIDFVLDLVKAPSGRTCRISHGSVLNKESVYVTLPFAVPDFRFHHELPGAVAEPIRDQFDGSCTAYYAARHFADVSNNRYGVTVSCPDAALFEYGHPRSCLIPAGQESQFERVMQYPANSRMYLYLMNNMFDVNIRWDQQGPVRFCWSLRSHAGGWQAGRADQFGWDVLNPLIAKVVAGKQKGSLGTDGSFVRIDQPNVVCSTLKPAEANGAGFIARFNETHGSETTATVALPFLDRLTAATETDLLENDRLAQLPVSNGNEVTFTLPPFGVKTIRLAAALRVSLPVLSALKARPRSDMQIELSWMADARAASRASHYNVYRGTRPDFAPSLRNLVGRPISASHVDQPRLHYGGWINNRLEPATTYYYRVSMVDRWNNEGPLSPPVAATTLRSDEQNMPPLRVECLRAVLISPISPQNFVNLLFRTSCESDVRRYEIHRSTRAGFEPDSSTCIGVADAETVVKGSTAYGHVPLDHRAGDYDHMMFKDDSTQPHATYFYRVCAVDTAGQRGPTSHEAVARPKLIPTAAGKVTAQSVYAPEYGPENAIDGNPDPFAAWISKPYGGGTKEQPLSTWWAIEFHGGKQRQLQGVKIIGDDREVIPLHRNLQVQVPEGSAWKTVGELKAATGRTVTVNFQGVVTAAGLRVLVPAADLPRSERSDVDGIVRICELMLVLPDGRESLVEPTM